MRRLFASILLAAVATSASAANLVPNSSFELGGAGWGVRTVIPRLSDDLQVVRPVSYSDEKAPHGTQALKLENPAGHTIQLASWAIAVTPGKYALSAYMRCDQPMKVAMNLFGAQPGNWMSPGKSFQVTTQWQRYECILDVPKEHPVCIVRVQFKNAGTLMIDGIQLEKAEAVTAYAPAAAVEAAVVAPNTYFVAGDHQVELRAVDYAGKGNGKSPFQVVAENASTGWKHHSQVEVDLSTPKAVTQKITLPLKNYGAIKLSGNGAGVEALPAYFAVFQPLNHRKIDIEKGFSIGINEIGCLRNVNEKHNPYQGLGVDLQAHMKMLHASGVAVVRLFESELTRPAFLNPERGKFDFSGVKKLLEQFDKSDLTGYITIDSGAFSYQPNARNYYHKINNQWFMVKEAKMGEKNPIRSITVYPKMQDWEDYVKAIVENCRGYVKYFEIMNEPNLRLTDPADYTKYLKCAYDVAKKVDPNVKIVGICATEDYGAAGGGYLGDCARLGAFKYLDMISFHPYVAALDSSAVSADKLIHEMDGIRKTHKSAAPLWNTEVFYLHSIKDNAVYRRTNPLFLRPQHLARRYLIDLGEGVQLSTPVHVWQLYSNPYVVMDADPAWLDHQPVPNASAVAQNAFAKLLLGAKPNFKLKLPAGTNGYCYRAADGKSVAAMWVIDADNPFQVQVPNGITVLDLFGNPIKVQGNSPLLLDDKPIYLLGENLEKLLPQIKVLPKNAVDVLGARFLTLQEVAVEFRNRQEQPVVITARIKGQKEVKTLQVPANDTLAVRFKVDAKEGDAIEVLYLYDDKHTRQTVTPIAPRKVMNSGDVITLGNGQVKFQATAKSDVLVITATVKDPKRGNRVAKQPWTGDCVELFIDTAPEKKLDIPLLGKDTYRLFIAPASANGLTAELTGSNNLETKYIQWLVQEKDGAYECQVVIPWTALGCNGPKEIGFDFIADDAEGDARKSYYAWAGDDSNYSSRFKFGRLLLPAAK